MNCASLEEQLAVDFVAGRRATIEMELEDSMITTRTMPPTQNERSCNKDPVELQKTSFADCCPWLICLLHSSIYMWPYS